jgi:hypothetical protein
MGKTRKPITARKPPVSSDSHAEIEDWIRRVMPDLHPIVERLDESIRETIPGLRFAVKWKNAYYGLPEHGWIIEMVAYDVSVNVVSTLRVFSGPIALLLLFVYVFGGALGEQTGSIEYVDFIAPGVIILTVISGIAYAALRLSTDLQKGIIGRFRTMPVTPSSVLSGQALSSTLSSLFSCFLVVVVAFLVGFRPAADTAAWLSFCGLLVLFTLATTWLAMFFGLLAKTPEGAGAFS